MSKRLQIALGTVVAVAVPLVAWGDWGLFSEEGRQQYDEMSAIGPAMSAFAGIVSLWFVGGAWAFSMLIRKHFGLLEFLGITTYFGILCAVTFLQPYWIIAVPRFFVG